MLQPMNATTIKRWFKQRFGIPVRVRTGVSKRPYIEAWISSEKTEKHTDPLVYKHEFPAALGNACMRVVYKGSPTLENQNWGGNIRSHSLAMHAEEWEMVIASFAQA